MDFNKLSETRKSTRGFTSQGIADGDILRLIESACNAPSAGNCQPWHFYVLNDQNIISSMQNRVFSEKWICSAYAIIVVCIDSKKTVERYGERGENLYCIQDTAAAIQNILLCATDMDISSCWVGAFNEKECSSVLELPNYHRPIALIPIGYSNNKGLKPKRKPLSSVLTFIGEKRDIHETTIDATLKFEHSNIKNSVFDDVNMQNTTFNNANMRNINITDANLADSTISQCNLTNVCIKNCIIEGMTINGIEINMRKDN